MSWQSLLLAVIPVLLSAVIVPSVAWLVKEVLALRIKLVALETRVEAMSSNCLQHHRWQEEISSAVTRTDRNVARLCESAGVQFDP